VELADSEDASLLGCPGAVDAVWEEGRVVGILHEVIAKVVLPWPKSLQSESKGRKLFGRLEFEVGHGGG